MNILQALILGLIQGLTEFIPVSSSGHLVIMHELIGASGGLTFDVALHLGTLAALILFFYKDLLSLASSLVKKSKQTRLAWLLILATIPAVITGVLLESAAENQFRSLGLVSINLLIVALVMLAAEYYFKHRTKKTLLNETSKGQAISMGLAQAAAGIPGVSRSGAAITAGLFGGMDRVAGTRFSFLLGVPIIFGASLKVLIKPDAFSQIGPQADIFIIGIFAAFISGFWAIKFLLRYLAKHSLNIFAYYRIGLALTILLSLALF